MKKVFIEELNLSPRSLNALDRGNKQYISDLLDMDLEKMKKLPGMGTKSVEEVKAVVKSLNPDDIIKIPEEIRPKTLEMIHLLIPESMIDPELHLEFPDENGQISDESLNILHTPLTQKTKKALFKLNIKTVDDLEHTPVKTFTKRIQLGTDVYGDVQEYFQSVRSQLSKNIDLLDALRHDSNSNFKEVIENSIIDVLLQKMGASKDHLAFLEFLCPLVKQTIQDHQENFSDDQNNNLKLIINALRKSPKLLATIQADLQHKLSIKQPIDIDQYFSLLPSSLLFDGLKDALVSNLDESILVQNGLLFNQSTSLKSWLNSLKKREQKVVIERIHGKTLEELGKEFGCTRERIRQIQVKLWNKKPQLNEDYYLPFYEQYNLDSKELHTIFDLDDLEIGYLKFSAEKSGSLPMENMINDKRLNSIIKSKILPALENRFINIGGTWVKKSKKLILKELVKHQTATQSIRTSDFYETYLEFLKDHQLDLDEFGWVSERAFAAYLQRQPYIIASRNFEIRYFPVDETDVVQLVKELDLSRYQDQEISTRLLYKENPELLKEYGLNDEYELHNLLNRTQEKWDPENKMQADFTRMPGVRFGNGSLEKQILNLLDLLAPISLNDFAAAVEEDFGFLPQSILANYYQLLAPYLNNGILHVNLPIFTEEQKQWLEQNLSKDFYLIEDIKSSFEKEFGFESLNNLNAPAFKQIGWKIFSKYILKSTYATAKDYFEGLLIQKSPIDLSAWDSRVTALNTFSAVKVDLLRRGILYELSPSILLSVEDFFRKFPQITLEEIDDFTNKAIRFGQQYPYFTLQFLINKGFRHPLLEKLKDIHVAGALLKNLRSIKAIALGNTLLFSNANSNFLSRDFLIALTDSYDDIKAIQSILKESYGIEVDSWKLKSVLDCIESSE